MRPRLDFMRGSLAIFHRKRKKNISGFRQKGLFVQRQAQRQALTVHIQKLRQHTPFRKSIVLASANQDAGVLLLGK